MKSLAKLELWRDIDFGENDSIRIYVRWYNDGPDIDDVIDIKMRQLETVATESNLFLSLKQWDVVVSTTAEMTSEIRAKAKAILGTNE